MYIIKINDKIDRCRLIPYLRHTW